MSLSLANRFKWSPLQRYVELLHILVERNLKGRYRGSFLGVYWSLLSPLLMTGMYTAIFGVAFKSYFNGSIVSYMLAAFTGLIIINFFSSSTSQALSSVVGGGSLMNKIRPPISVFPLSMIVANVFQFSVGSFPLLAIVTFIHSKNPLHVLALLFPLIGLTLVCTGVGFLVAALYVFFRDLPYFYELITFTLWMGSPIFYPVDIVPPQVRPFLYLNPLFPIIESIREISLFGNLPWGLMLHSLLNGIILLAVGWLFFRAWQDQFMDLL